MTQSFTIFALASPKSLVTLVPSEPPAKGFIFSSSQTLGYYQSAQTSSCWQNRAEPSDNSCHSETVTSHFGTPPRPDLRRPPFLISKFCPHLPAIASLSVRPRRMLPRSSRSRPWISRKMIFQVDAEIARAWTLPAHLYTDPQHSARRERKDLLAHLAGRGPRQPGRQSRRLLHHGTDGRTVAVGTRQRRRTARLLQRLPPPRRASRRRMRLAQAVSLRLPRLDLRARRSAAQRHRDRRRRRISSRRISL